MASMRALKSSHRSQAVQETNGVVDLLLALRGEMVDEVIDRLISVRIAVVHRLNVGHGSSLSQLWGVPAT
jgi:hypothetical protein